VTAAGLLVISGLFSVAFFGLIVVIWAAQIRSCFVPTHRTQTAAGPVPRVPTRDSANDVRLVRRLATDWEQSGRSIDSISVWMLDDADVNAASVGRGTFVLWTGLAMLRDDEIDAVFAHEMAHDWLRHAQKSRELADVANVIGDALSTIAGADEGTEATLKRWSGNFVVPRYSRAQELQADSLGVVLLAEAGHTEAAALFCRTLRTLRSTAGEAGGSFFDSHPGLSERMHRVGSLFPSQAARQACS